MTRTKTPSASGRIASRVKNTHLLCCEQCLPYELHHGCLLMSATNQTIQSWSATPPSPEYLAESRVASFLAASIALPVIATVFVLARVYTRAVILVQWSIDDTLIMIAWVGCTPFRIPAFQTATSEEKAKRSQKRERSY